MLLELFAQALRRLLSGERPDLDPVEHAVDGIRALENRLDAAQRRPQIAREQFPGTPRIRLAADRRQLDAEVAIGRDRRRGGGLSAAVSVAARGCALRLAAPLVAPAGRTSARIAVATGASGDAGFCGGAGGATRAAGTARSWRADPGRSPPDPAAPRPRLRSGPPAPQLRAARLCPRPALRCPRPAPPRPRTPPSPRRAGDRARPRPPAVLGRSRAALALPTAPAQSRARHPRGRRPRPRAVPQSAPVRRRAAAEAARARAAGARAGRPARHRSTAVQSHPLPRRESSSA